MKKLISKMLFLILVIFAPVSAMAGVSVHIGIPLPPPIVFPVPPAVVVIPQTDVYAVPDIEEDIFFYGGWWWRPWDGRWYRSRYYDRGWAHYGYVPSFYRHVYPGWRNNYRERKWGGYHWEHQRVPSQELRQNWRGWEKNRHWERQNYWGVQGLPPQHQPYQRDARKRGNIQSQPQHNSQPGYRPGPGQGHPR